MRTKLLPVAALIVLTATMLIVQATTSNAHAVCAGGGSVFACAFADDGFETIAKAFGAIATAVAGG